MSYSCDKIPFVNIKKIEKLKVIGDLAEETAKELEESLELVRNKFDRQKDAVKELLESQLEALRSQYELGLISRYEYQQQAEQYAQEADKQQLAVEKEMNKHLEAIEEGTETIEEVLGLPFNANYNDVLITQDLTDVIPININPVPRGDGFYEADSNSIKWMPSTIAADVKQGIPVNKVSSAMSSNVSVTLNVNGSVLTENELVDTVYSGIVNGIEKRRYAPLGVA